MIFAVRADKAINRGTCRPSNDAEAPSANGFGPLTSATSATGQIIDNPTKAPETSVSDEGRDTLTEESGSSTLKDDAA